MSEVRRESVAKIWGDCIRSVSDLVDEPIDQIVGAERVSLMDGSSRCLVLKSEHHLDDDLTLCVQLKARVRVQTTPGQGKFRAKERRASYTEFRSHFVSEEAETEFWWLVGEYRSVHFRKFLSDIRMDRREFKVPDEVIRTIRFLHLI